MADPKPIRVSGAAPAASGPGPQPFAIVAEGYDATKTQTLKNVNGVIKWVTDPATP